MVATAMTRAIQCRRMLVPRDCPAIAELAAHQGSKPSLDSRILRLSLLAPDCVDTIPDRRQVSKFPLSSVKEKMWVNLQLQLSKF